MPGYEGKYVASPDGHIYCFSDARVNAKRPKPFRLTEAIGNEGYPFVSTIHAGRRRSKSVHVLVCQAFHGMSPSRDHVVRHLDGNKRNNASENLRWGTYSENEADKRRHGTASFGEAHGAAKLTDEAVRILRIAIPHGLWDVINAAEVFGVDPSVIRNAVSGKTWKHVE